MADCNIKEIYFKDRGAAAVQMHTRKHHLFKELNDLGSDIYCFQEVDLSFLGELKNWGVENGFESEFEKKSDPDKNEGSLTLYNQNRFKLLKRYHVHLNLTDYINFAEIKNESQLGIFVFIFYHKKILK